MSAITPLVSTEAQGALDKWLNFTKWSHRLTKCLFTTWN